MAYNHIDLQQSLKIRCRIGVGKKKVAYFCFLHEHKHRKLYLSDPKELLMNKICFSQGILQLDHQNLNIILWETLCSRFAYEL